MPKVRSTSPDLSKSPDAVLELALARLLPPPPWPDGLHDRLLDSLRRNTPAVTAAMRQRLQAERDRTMVVLRADWLRLRRETLMMLMAAAFSAGAAAHHLLPMLQQRLGLPASLLALCIVLVLGSASAALTLRHGSG